MSTFTDALDAKLPTTTAGALPSTRTFGMVTDALESGDVAELSGELQHTRAHYQSLEYMLAMEDQIVETILGSWDADAAPKPTTVEEAVRLTARVYRTEVLEAAYNNAHQIGFFLAMGLTVQEALQAIYGDLDFSDPERELSDAQLMDLSGQGDDED